MGFNLWMSEDSHYRLRNRIGTQTSETQVEWTADAPAQSSPAEMDHIGVLMETLANRPQTDPQGGPTSA
jgi:hypothetical protein